MIEVLCIGYACYDLIYYPDTEIKHNRKHFIRTYDESGGGPAANAAFLLSKWGIETAFAGVLGTDHEAAAVLKEFHAVKTRTELVKQEKEFSTPFSSIIIHPETGERTILTRHMDLPPYSPDWESLPELSPKIILTDGYQLDAALQAKKIFPDAVLIMDAGSLRDATKTLLPVTDVVICSEPFGSTIIDMPYIDTQELQQKALLAIQKMCPGNIAITLGEQGLMYLDNSAMQHIPAFRVDAVDTTAAGDIFHGAYVYAHLQGMGFQDGLVFASAAAALSVSRKGGRNSIPTLKEVETFMEEFLTEGQRE